MKINELKNGAVVVLRNGEKFLKVDDTLLNMEMNGLFLELNDYRNNLTNIHNEKYDIIEVETENLKYFNIAKRTVGSLRCRQEYCVKCPMRCFKCFVSSGYLNERWQQILVEFPQLGPMREYIEKELDKEVEK